VLKTPVFVWWPKLSSIGRCQYLDVWPPKLNKSQSQNYITADGRSVRPGVRPFWFMRYKTIFVIPITLDCSESEFFNSVIICCTTIDTVSMSSESKLFTIGSQTDWPLSWCRCGRFVCSELPRRAAAKDKVGVPQTDWPLSWCRSGRFICSELPRRAEENTLAVVVVGVLLDFHFCISSFACPVCRAPLMTVLYSGLTFRSATCDRRTVYRRFHSPRFWAVIILLIVSHSLGSSRVGRIDLTPTRLSHLTIIKSHNTDILNFTFYISPFTHIVQHCALGLNNQQLITSNFQLTKWL
jgi:hypothetical protein